MIDDEQIRECQQLYALEVTHPAWRITIRPHGPVRWWATRYVPPTLAQISAGMVATVARHTGEALSSALAHQDEIAQRVG